MAKVYGEFNQWLRYTYNGYIINVDMTEIVKFHRRNGVGDGYYLLRGNSEAYFCGLEEYSIIEEFVTGKDTQDE